MGKPHWLCRLIGHRFAVLQSMLTRDAQAFCTRCAVYAVIPAPKSKTKEDSPLAALLGPMEN